MASNSSTANERSPLSLRALIAADLASMADLKKERWPSAAGFVQTIMLPGMVAVIMFRFAHALHHAGVRPLSRILYFMNVVLFGADIAPGANIGPGFAVPHPVGIVIGDAVRAGARLRVMAGVQLGAGGFEDQSLDGMPTIGDDCWMFGGAKVFGPISVGDRVVVAANALVARDVPSNVFVAGSPAEVKRQRSLDER